MPKVERSQSSYDDSAPRRAGLIRTSPLPFVVVVRFFAILSVFLMVFWLTYYRRGLAFPAPTDPNLLFNVHPLLMLLGLIVLPSEAFLVFKVLVFKAIRGSKPVKKTLHLTIHLVGLMLASVGLYAVFAFHNKLHIRDLYSLHSWLGLGAIALFTLQWLIGLFSFFFSGISTPAVRAGLLPWHVFAGLFVFGLTIATAELGLLEKLSFMELKAKVDLYSGEAMLVNSIGVILLLFGGSVILVAAIQPKE